MIACAFVAFHGNTSNMTEFNITGEISARHVHISQKDLEQLMGKGAALDCVKTLSQPGQFLAAQRVCLIGPKNALENVAIIGPIRKETQVEISRTDTYLLGIKNVPVRESGNLKDTPGLTLKYGEKTLDISQGVIVVKRHLHLDTATAEEKGLKDKDVVTLKFSGERGGILENAIVRVSDSYANAVHIDSDEANAMGFGCGQVTIIQGDK